MASDSKDAGPGKVYVKSAWDDEDVPVHKELTRQEMIEYQIKTREFDGYKHYGQLPDLDGGILCLDFPVFAKAKALADDKVTQERSYRSRK